MLSFGGTLAAISLGAVLDVTIRSGKKRKFADFFFGESRDVSSLVFTRALGQFRDFFCNSANKVQFRRSALLTIFAFLLLCVGFALFASVNPLSEDFGRAQIIGLSLVFTFNLFGDYLSLLQTHFLFGRLVGKPAWITAVGLLADIVFTFIIWAAAISIIFWLIASLSPEHRASWASPINILWHICHQATATTVFLSNDDSIYQAACASIIEPPNKMEIRGFERFFLTISMGTTYVASAWLAYATVFRFFGLGMQKLFPRISRWISRYVNPWSTPFTIVITYVFLYLAVTVTLLGLGIRAASALVNG